MTEQGNYRPKLPSQHYSNCTDVTLTATAATPGRSKQGSAAEAPRARFGAVPVPAALRQHSNATESPSHPGRALQSSHSLSKRSSTGITEHRAAKPAFEHRLQRAP